MGKLSYPMNITADDRTSIASYLPLERMASLGPASTQAYATAKPFPHIAFDDFFDPALLDKVLTEFPKPGAIKWQKFDNDKEIKLANAVDSAFGPTTRLFLYHLNSISFLNFLSTVTGIANLIPDPHFDGGGLHQIVRGGKLGVHVDFNRHPRYELDRRVNVLLYLNKNWREEYGGHIQLWDRDMKACVAKHAPLFNRMVIFSTTDFTYHGHPDPLTCPEGVTRKSLALYYFTNGRPAEEVSGAHSTIFKERAEGEFKLTFGQKMRRLASDLLPPIVTRGLKKIF